LLLWHWATPTVIDLTVAAATGVPAVGTIARDHRVSVSVEAFGALPLPPPRDPPLHRYFFVHPLLLLDHIRRLLLLRSGSNAPNNQLAHPSCNSVDDGVLPLFRHLYHIIDDAFLWG
jgi:hypothetical protein